MKPIRASNLLSKQGTMLTTLAILLPKKGSKAWALHCLKGLLQLQIQQPQECCESSSTLLSLHGSQLQ
jgi:hypothetical protein